MAENPKYEHKISCLYGTVGVIGAVCPILKKNITPGCIACMSTSCYYRVHTEDCSACAYEAGKEESAAIFAKKIKKDEV